METTANTTELLMRVLNSEFLLNVKRVKMVKLISKVNVRMEKENKL